MIGAFEFSTIYRQLRERMEGNSFILIVYHYYNYIIIFIYLFMVRNW